MGANSDEEIGMRYLTFFTALFPLPISYELNNYLLILTVNVVDLEEEFDFVVRTLPRELVHGIDELLQWDRPIVVLVEDVKNALHKEWLDRRRGTMKKAC